MSRSKELMTSYMEETLTENEAVEFEAWLKADAANLKEFVMELARNEQLRRAVIASEPNTVADVKQTSQAPARKWSVRSRRAVKWMLAASLIVAVSWFLLPNENSASIVTFEGASGPVSLQTEGGNESGLTSGETFATGTLRIGGEGTRANFSYADGSNVSVAGGTELKFASGNGKQLVLHRGTLAANISPQTKRSPLVLRTPTAEATILKTSLIVDAEEAATLLRVNRGDVQLRRLADNQILMVAQNQEAVAERDTAKPLQAKAVKPLSTEWKASPKAEKDVTWFGKWNREGTLNAVPRKVFRKVLDKDETHHHAGAYSDFPGLVTLQKNSAIRIRYRIEKPLNVGVFLSTRAASWDFTGNFQAYIVEQKTPADEDGWRTATIPIESFQPLHRSGMAFQPGCVAATLFATTYTNDVGLEVSKFEVITIEEDAK